MADNATLYVIIVLDALFYVKIESLSGCFKTWRAMYPS